MNKRLGCSLFVILGLAWFGFVMLEFFATTMGDCADDQACKFYRPYVSGMVIWRGLAVALMLILAFVAWRHFNPEDDDV